MFEWLKTILGEQYTEEIDKKVSAEIGKGFVAKSDYNAKNEAYKGLEGQIAQRDTQLEALKKIDAAGMQAELLRLQEENKTAKASFDTQVEALKFDHALESALVAAKVRNPRAAKAMLEGNLKEGESLAALGLPGVQAGLQGLQKTDQWLFEGAGPLTGVRPAPSGDRGGEKDHSTMSYAELCTYLSENPQGKLQ